MIEKTNVKNNAYNVREINCVFSSYKTNRESQAITKMYCVIRPDWFVIENRKQNLGDKQKYLKWRDLHVESLIKPAGFLCAALIKTQCGFLPCEVVQKTKIMKYCYCIAFLNLIKKCIFSYWECYICQFWTHSMPNHVHLVIYCCDLACFCWLSS